MYYNSTIPKYSVQSIIYSYFTVLPVEYSSTRVLHYTVRIDILLLLARGNNRNTASCCHLLMIHLTIHKLFHAKHKITLNTFILVIFTTTPAIALPFFTDGLVHWYHTEHKTPSLPWFFSSPFHYQSFEFQEIICLACFYHQTLVIVLFCLSTSLQFYCDCKQGSQ